NVYIVNNQVGRNLGPSISGNSPIDGLVVDKNKLVEPEIATLSTNKERVAILLNGDTKNVSITRNTITLDNTTNVKYAILVNGNPKIEGNTIEPSNIPLQAKGGE